MGRRLPALHLTVVAMALCCCFIHASSSRVIQGARAAPAFSGSDDQAIVPGEVEAGVVSAGGGGGGRMGIELQDYAGSGANDRHSPWAQQRRN
ncbi:hypothetical protein ACP4OV_013302 [Aristida adscensionis]